MGDKERDARRIGVGFKYRFSVVVFQLKMQIQRWIPIFMGMTEETDDPKKETGYFFVAF